MKPGNSYVAILSYLDLSSAYLKRLFNRKAVLSKEKSRPMKCRAQLKWLEHTIRKLFVLKAWAILTNNHGLYKPSFYVPTSRLRRIGQENRKKSLRSRTKICHVTGMGALYNTPAQPYTDRCDPWVKWRHSKWQYLEHFGRSSFARGRSGTRAEWFRKAETLSGFNQNDFLYLFKVIFFRNQMKTNLMFWLFNINGAKIPGTVYDLAGL